MSYYGKALAELRSDEEKVSEEGQVPSAVLLDAEHEGDAENTEGAELPQNPSSVVAESVDDTENAEDDELEEQSEVAVDIPAQAAPHIPYAPESGAASSQLASAVPQQQAGNFLPGGGQDLFSPGDVQLC